MLILISVFLRERNSNRKISVFCCDSFHLFVSKLRDIQTIPNHFKDHIYYLRANSDILFLCIFHSNQMWSLMLSWRNLRRRMLQYQKNRNLIKDRNLIGNKKEWKNIRSTKGPIFFNRLEILRIKSKEY